MVWTSSIGSSITVPGDKNPNDPTDKRDYLVLGEDIPPEISSLITVGILYHAGQYVAGSTYMTVKYFGTGARNGVMRRFVYVENYKNVVGDNRLIFLDGTTLDADYTVSNSMGPVDGGSIGSAGPIATRNTTFGGILRDSRQSSPSTMYDTVAGNYRGNMLSAGCFGGDYMFPSYEAPTIALLSDGTVKMDGIVGFDALTVGGNTPVAQLAAMYRPKKDLIFLCMGGNNRPCRVDVRASGAVYFQGGAASDFAFTTGGTTSSSYLSLSNIAYLTAEFG